MNNKGNPYKVGLALSGGGARGIAHLGALQAIEEHNIFPQIISGTSSGALAGVLYADGYKPREICSLFRDKAFKEFAELSIPSTSFFRTDRLKSFLQKYLRTKLVENLPIKVVIVATDIERGKSVHFTRGDLIPTIVASCSIPLLFNPIEISDSHYIDGGIFKNFPVSVIRKECDTIIGINVTPISPQKFKKSMFYIAERSFSYMMLSNTLNDRKLCDLLIEPEGISEHSLFALDHVDNLFDIGYRSTLAALKTYTHILSNPI